MTRVLSRAFAAFLWSAACQVCSAAPGGLPSSPAITNIHVQPGQIDLRFDPYPSAQSYTVLSGTNPAILQPDTSFFQAPYMRGTNGTRIVYGYEWRSTNVVSPVGFYRVAVTPLPSTNVLAGTVLSRLAYGPTPDLLERLSAEGPDHWIHEQLQPWSIEEAVSLSHTNLPFIEERFVAADAFVWPTNASITDLRARHVLRAVGANRQLLEVLLQFLENHFVTQVDKTRDYFEGYYNDSNLENRLAAQTEYLELERWREALLNPQCTFHDLLKISAESPAMIVYLDTVSSRGDGNRVANENFARELLELFTFGVDNGYDQNDITVMSRAWTGWTLEKVAFTNVTNPFALATTNIIPGSSNVSTTVKSNLYGAWTLNFRSNWHNTSTKTLFPGKTVPARFGPPYAGSSYQLVLSNGGGTNGMRDGYQVLAHLANQPFTQEFISSKLCRLLVHDDFPSPNSDPDTAEYHFYDYASENLAPEAALVHACMEAWETNSPKGQIWKVVETIVRSDLFRGQAASLQKVKTPLELAVSALRALRSSTNGSGLFGSFTAFTDGFNIVGTSSTAVSPLTRMGEMSLFNRESPDGYPEAGPPWISAGTLAERLRFLQAFCIAPGQSGHADAGNSRTGCDPVGLLRSKLPQEGWRDTAAVVDYFLSLLYPAEGTANLALYRQAAMTYLNTNDDGNPSPFSNLTVSSTANSAYDNRVRGMVGMLITQPRFQEQ